MKVYTKTGDKGTTSLLNGKRVKKSNNRINLLGTLDELNSFIGLLVTELKETTFLKEKQYLEQVQNRIFDIGAIVANPTYTEQPTNKTSSVTKEKNENNQNSKKDLYLELTNQMEAEIDSITNDLPTLKNFILPGGNRASAVAHICRTTCRKAEREYHTQIPTKNIDTLNHIGMYLNRFSDYLFELARYLNYKTGEKDIIWKAN